MILSDILRPGLALVLCGSAPSRVSKEAQAYYAHPGNIFWQTLHEVGLTRRRLRPEEYSLVLDEGIGLTDLNKTEWGADSELSREALDVSGFTAKMQAHRPAVVAFTSKFAAQTFLGRRTVGYGLQPESLDGTRLFVLPSPSGRARRYFDPAPWRELAALVAALR
jgi:TDG/mug DNA glycosylase family protein